MYTLAQNFSETCVIRICGILDYLDFRQHFKLHHWPVLGFIWGILTLIIPYAISVLNGHVYYYFPYVSNSGALPPESCIFGMMFDIGSIILVQMLLYKGLFTIPRGGVTVGCTMTSIIFFRFFEDHGVKQLVKDASAGCSARRFMGVNVYIRYRQVDDEIDSGYILLRKEWNTLSLWLGMSIPAGLCVVGHFQETSIYAIHIVGAILSFGIGSAYFLVQTRISYADDRKLSAANPNNTYNKFIVFIRTILSLTFYPLLLSTVIYGGLALTEFKGESVIWWTEEHGGFQYRLISTFSEWILVILMFFYVLSLKNDFITFTYENINFSHKVRVESNGKKAH